MMLGGMGADVIKVGLPETGDDTRTWGPPFVGKRRTYFLGSIAHKRSLRSNMR